MMLLVLLAIVIAAWWFVSELRKTQRVVQLEAMRRPDWVPPNQCPVCDQPMQVWRAQESKPNDELTAILFCSQADCPIWRWPVYFQSERVWSANPLVVPVVGWSEAYKKAVAMSRSDAEAK